MSQPSQCCSQCLSRSTAMSHSNATNIWCPLHPSVPQSIPYHTKCLPSTQVSRAICRDTCCQSRCSLHLFKSGTTWYDTSVEGLPSRLSATSPVICWPCFIHTISSNPINPDYLYMSSCSHKCLYISVFTHDIFVTERRRHLHAYLQ